ncbi:hypothetical protein NKI96_11275 [Mesorhizobium sp. M0292]|uniref:hypothetical protein n=1 Tax=Mesorhizobium sp. M0292 TaxID=2956929 RepID=UPI00333C3766
MIALLGGGSFVLIAVCAYIAKLVADHSIEGHKGALNTELERLKNELAKESDLHKLKLRKAEILFDRELVAVVDFGKLYRQIAPSYSHPDMDWDDACTDVANRFSTIEKQLDNYLTNHAPVLTEELREKLGRCATIASHNKFAGDEMPGAQAAATTKAEAAKLLDELQVVQNGLFAMVKNETRG